MATVTGDIIQQILNNVRSAFGLNNQQVQQNKAKQINQKVRLDKPNDTEESKKEYTDQQAKARNNQINQAVTIDVQEPDIDKQVNDRFKTSPSGSVPGLGSNVPNPFIDSQTNEAISAKEKAAREAAMRDAYSDRINASEGYATPTVSKNEDGTYSIANQLPDNVNAGKGSSAVTAAANQSGTTSATGDDGSVYGAMSGGSGTNQRGSSDVSSDGGSNASGPSPVGGSAGGTEEAIGNVANGVTFKSLDNRDFSDEFNDWLANKGLDYSGIGQFMVEGTYNDWMQMVQDETLRDWYQGLYSPAGEFSTNNFDDMFYGGRSKSFNDVFNSDGAYYNASDYTGYDYDTVTDLIKYVIGSNQGADARSYSNKAENYTVLPDDIQGIIDAYAYDFLANETARALSSGYEGDFSSKFTLDDINRFMNLDDWEIGAIGEEGFQTADELGRNNPNMYITSTPAWYADESNTEGVPVQGLIDNVLTLLGDQYGARTKSSQGETSGDESSTSGSYPQISKTVKLEKKDE